MIKSVYSISYNQLPNILMKNLFYILNLVFLISSCETINQNISQNEFYSNDFKNFSTESDFQVLNLDSIANFEKLKTKMGNLTCEDKSTGLKFKLKENVYYVTAFAQCPTFRGAACYFRTNDITIKNDTISSIQYENVEIPIEKLGEVLDEIISDPYNYQYGKEKLKDALIHIYVNDNHSIQTIKKDLKEIIENFSKINSSKNPDLFKYYILIEGYDKSKIPPPPPPPNIETTN